MSIIMAKAILRVLFPSKCKHPHDGKVCLDKRVEGVTLTHHPPTHDWRGNPGPDGPRQPLATEFGPDGVKGPDGVRD